MLFFYNITKCPIIISLAFLYDAESDIKTPNVKPDSKLIDV